MSGPRLLEVYLAALDPTMGSEIQKTRPCVVVSPDEMNRHLRTVLVAPLTSSGRDYPWRVPVLFEARQGHAALDQLRAVERTRLVKRLGTLSESEGRAMLDSLTEMFRPAG